MKKLAFLLLLFSSQLNAQQYYKIGLKEGFNTSMVSGDSYRGFSKFGFVGGAYFKGALKGAWTMGGEVIFTQKGSRHRSDYESGDFTSYFLELNYVEVPLLFQYNIEDFNIEFGPGYGFLIKTKEIVTINGSETDGTHPFNDGEVSLNIGANYTFKSRFGVNFRYTNSVLPIRSSPYTKYGQLSSVFALCLTFEFGSDGSMWK